jgi:formylglycine-generating enzyme
MRTFFAAAAVGVAVVTALLPRAPVVRETRSGLVLVPAGPFVMGSRPEQAEAAFRAYGGDISYYRAEVPQRVLNLPSFWIERTEVTNEAYRAFVHATGRRAPEASAAWAAPYVWKQGDPPPGLRQHPVTLVSADDAQAYCHWRGMALPSEEQWEKAARGVDGRTYPWGEGYAAWRLAGAEQRSEWRLDRIELWLAWWKGVYRGRMRGTEVGTYPVGSFPAGASPYGALDMAGNVFEWVDATFDPYPGGAADAHPDFGHGYRVVRGGDWYLDRIYHRTAARLRAPAEHKVPTIGFRCVSAE